MGKKDISSNVERSIFSKTDLELAGPLLRKGVGWM
jgi:hypothetical protein